MSIGQRIRAQRINSGLSQEKVAELAEDIHSKVIGTLSRSELVTDAEEQQKTVMEAYPNSPMAEEYRVLAKQIRKLCGI